MLKAQLGQCSLMRLGVFRIRQDNQWPCQGNWQLPYEDEEEWRQGRGRGGRSVFDRQEMGMLTLCLLICDRPFHCRRGYEALLAVKRCI